MRSPAILNPSRGQRGFKRRRWHPVARRAMSDDGKPHASVATTLAAHSPVPCRTRATAVRSTWPCRSHRRRQPAPLSSGIAADDLIRRTTSMHRRFRHALDQGVQKAEMPMPRQMAPPGTSTFLSICFEGRRRARGVDIKCCVYYQAANFSYIFTRRR